MKLSNTQLILLAGGVGLVGLYLAKRQPGSPFSLDNLFRTVMPNAPTDAQLAAHFARQSGRGPVQAGTSGAGVTSAQPAYASLLPGLGSFVGGLFTKIAGPGNTAPASRPQASASSGGGIAQPTPGTGWTIGSDLSGVYFGEFDNSYGDFGDLAAYGANYEPVAPYAGPEVIQSDMGTYDVGSGTWY